MLRIEVQVPESRAGAAVVRLTDGFRTIAEDFGAASVAREIAQTRGNPGCDPLRPSGHPPYGSYLLLSCAPAPRGAEMEYGHHLLLFEPQSGPALEAESFGRLALLAYSGAPGRDGHPRRTQGGLRLPESIVQQVVSRFEANDDIEVSILVSRPPAWWQFWKQAIRTSALSADPPRFVAPPLDETSLMQELLQGAVRRGCRLPERSDDDWDRSRDRDSSRSTTEREPPFAGRGGQFGGAGASSIWDDAVTARPPGVDASGRIMAGAAGAALGATAAAEASAETRDSQPEPSDHADGGTQTSTAY